MKGRHLLLVATVLAVAAAGCLGGDGSGGAGDQWSFTDTEGRQHTAGNASGSPTVMFFMATWCPSCKDQTGPMRTVADNYTSRGVDVYSLSWDPDEGDDDLRQWKRDHDQDWPHGNDPGLAIAKRYGVQSQSTVVILDASNELVRRWDYGEKPTADDMGAVLDDLLEG